MPFTKSLYAKRRLKMIKSFHVTTPCMSILHCPAQTPTLRSQMGRLIQSLLGKRQILVKLPRSVKPESCKAGVGAIPTLPTSFWKIARMVANCLENSRWHIIWSRVRFLYLPPIFGKLTERQCVCLLNRSQHIIWLHRFESCTFRQITLSATAAFIAGHVLPCVSGYFFGNQ